MKRSGDSSEEHFWRRITKGSRELLKSQPSLKHPAELLRSALSVLRSRRAALNSPFYFNVGAPHAAGTPQTSACFIIPGPKSVSDIARHLEIEKRIFDFGSGVGWNAGSYEDAHHLLPVLDLFDLHAGLIQSGGVSRRSAKMVVLDIHHPSSEDFINAKAHEENSRGLATSRYQNANFSVRVPDSFMRMSRRDPQSTSGKRLRQIAQAAWACGDPGVHFSDTIESMNPCRALAPIVASNPCSEFLFLNHTACNLSSVQLRRYADTRRPFDWNLLTQDIRTLARFQDALLEGSSFPSPEIAENTRELRPLGIGFMNLGGFLMARGLPYDCDESRSWGAAISHHILLAALEASMTMAHEQGPYAHWRRVKKDHLDVVDRHFQSASDADLSVLPPALRTSLMGRWKQLIVSSKKWGLRNAQLTLVAPTGTIGIFLDSDTLGIEPDFALVKTKHFSSGRVESFINSAVTPGLCSLGYEKEFARATARHIRSGQKIDEIRGLDPAHWKLFQTASGADFQDRAQGTLSVDGHLDMCAAVQPFLSGGISKTVNLPKNATVDQVQRVFDLAHRAHLKAISVYRDGSKLGQPLTTGDQKASFRSFEFACIHCGGDLVMQGRCQICRSCGHGSICS